MGIPSFYRQLCRKFPHIISNTITRPEWLCLDFNCGMYGCLKNMRPFDGSEKWESDFCSAIVSYMEEIIALVKPTAGTYVACDGVVCAAKRRQQRLRRFKGPWMAASEAALAPRGGGEGEGEGELPKWDQNALTPGSLFMSKLNRAIEEAGKRHSRVIVSTTAEAGEGEHKLLSHMRGLKTKPASCMIYGLDADLLLLSLMLMHETGAEVHLLREAQEFERSENGWKTLSIRNMAIAMNLTQIPDFVATMSLLGNDFLPRSMTRTVRENGIQYILDSLSSKTPIVVKGVIQPKALSALIQTWASTEEADMLVAVMRAIKEKRRFIHGATAQETALNEWQATPARWATLATLLDPQTKILRRNWKDIYRGWGTGDCAKYCEGLAWIWEYYSGKKVDQGWMFEDHLPPLWCDLAEHLKAKGDISPPPIVYHEPLPAWLHLLAVLPAESVMRLLPPEKQRFMGRAPLYWPSRWALFDVGRTQMWECEPVIPILPDCLLRSFENLTSSAPPSTKP